MRSARMQILMDKSAIALSTICAIHCLFLPVVLIMLPALATTSLASESFHHLLLWFVFPISALALTQGCRHHKDRKVLTFGILGLVLLIGTAIVGHELLTEEGERVATLLGATSLAFGHFRNYSLCRNKKCNF